MSQTTKTSFAPALVLISLFFMWGLITSLNDILIPHFKALFDLSYTEAMLIQFCFFGAYFVTSFPAGFLVQRIGYRRGIIAGLLVAALGCLGFYPAGMQHSYAMFLASLFVLASGVTLLQVAANPYVAILGDSRGAASRLNLTQAFNSLGTTIGPWVGAVLILSVASAGADQTRILYLILAALLFAIAVVFSSFKLPAAAAVSQAGTSTTAHERESIWHSAHLLLGAVAIFFYVGAEVTIGSFLVNFLAQPQIAGLSADTAGKYVSMYWGGAMIGRFVGAAILRRVRAGSLLASNAVCAVLCLIVAMTTHGETAVVSILSVGLFNSIMFPTIFTLGVANLGACTGTGSGLLCMAIVGGAIIPVIAGSVADVSTIALAFGIPVLCYAYIAFYGLKGHRGR